MWNRDWSRVRMFGTALDRAYDHDGRMMWGTRLRQWLEESMETSSHGLSHRRWISLKP